MPGGSFKVLYKNLFTIEVYKENDWQEMLGEMERILLQQYPQAKSFYDEEIADSIPRRHRRHYVRDGVLDFMPPFKA